MKKTKVGRLLTIAAVAALAAFGTTAFAEECICDEKCKPGRFNTNCPVCSAEDAELNTVCQGKKIFVTNEAELRTAVADTRIESIILGAAIELENPLVITRAFELDGNNCTLSVKTPETPPLYNYVLAVGNTDASSCELSDLYIHGVTFVCPEKATEDAAGVYLTAKGTATNNIRISDNTFKSADGIEPSVTQAIGILTTYNDVSYVEISGNNFFELKYGMYFNSLKNATVTSNFINTTRYNGIIFAADNQDYLVESVEVSGNTLTNIATADYENVKYASGIAIGKYHNDDVDITGNYITMSKDEQEQFFDDKYEVALNGTKMETLTGAVEYLKEHPMDDQCIQLLKDVVSTEPINLNGIDQLYVDGMGHSISFEYSSVNNSIFTGKDASNREGIQAYTELTLDSVEFVNSNTGSPKSGYAVLIGFDSRHTNINIYNCTFTNLFAAVLSNPMITPGKGNASINMRECTFKNTAYGYSIDECTDGSYVGKITVFYDDNSATNDGFKEFEPWKTIWVTNSNGITKAYSSWENAYNVAQTDEKLTLNMDVTVEKTTLTKRVEIVTNGYTFTATGTSGEYKEPTILRTVTAVFDEENQYCCYIANEDILSKA